MHVMGPKKLKSEEAYSYLNKREAEPQLFLSRENWPVLMYCKETPRREERG